MEFCAACATAVDGGSGHVAIHQFAGIYVPSVITATVVGYNASHQCAATHTSAIGIGIIVMDFTVIQRRVGGASCSSDMFFALCIHMRPGIVAVYLTTVCGAFINSAAI